MILYFSFFQRIVTILLSSIPHGSFCITNNGLGLILHADLVPYSPFFSACLPCRFFTHSFKYFLEENRLEKVFKRFVCFIILFFFFLVCW